MILQNLQGKTIVLASKSPRRQQLLKGLELDFESRTSIEIDEWFPPSLYAENIALYLSQAKSAVYLPSLAKNEVLITADTIVWVNEHVLNKPADRAEAIAMLEELNGRTHIVYTGITIATTTKELSFFDETKVEFAQLNPEEIEYYVDNYKPFDKAGAYGVQELIGYIGIKKLEGSYFNVMGLPVQKLYEELKKF